MPMRKTTSCERRPVVRRAAKRRASHRGRKALAVFVSLALAATTLQLPAAMAVGGAGGGVTAREASASNTSGVDTAQATDAQATDAAATDAQAADAASADASNDAAETADATDAATEAAAAQEAEEATAAEPQSAEVEEQAANSAAIIPAALDDLTDSDTCKIIRGTEPLYYATLADALKDAQANETVEVFKSHTLSEAVTVSVAGVTIKNITDPYDWRENPTQNGSTDAQPVVTFAAAGQLTFSADATLSGVIFNGGNTARTVSAVSVAGGTTTVSDGAAGAEGTGIEATTCTFRNFNSTGASGSVFNIASGATLSFTAGSIESNTGTNDVGAPVYSSGTFTMTGGSISGNTAYTAGAIYAASGTVSLSDDAKITRNTSTLTGLNSSAGIYAAGDSAVNISGGEISGNLTRGGAGAVILAGATSTLTVTGGKITGNKSRSSNICAVYGYNSGCKIEISGNAYIYGNGVVNAATFDADITSPYNISASSAQMLSIGDLTKDARLGFSKNTLCTASTQFATASSGTASTTKYLACISNDVNPSYAPVAGTGAAIQWSDGTAVCKITDAAGITTYYTSLAAALSAAKADETVEIFKSHNFYASGTAAALTPAVAGITIKNVDTPLNSAEDWTKNGNATAPVVTFEAASRIIFTKNATIQGVIFDGANNERASSGIFVSGGATLTINDGAAGTGIDGTTALQTSTTFKNFYNTSVDSKTSGGGFAKVTGATIEMYGGTISGCKATGNNSWNGGGHAAVIYDNGVFKLCGGTVTGCGYETTVAAGDCSNTVFYMSGKNSTFHMEGGTISGNTCSVGGALNTYYNAGTASGNVIELVGGEISGNTAARHGSAVYMRNATITIGDGMKISGNTSGGGGVIDADNSCTINLTGGEISGNNCTCEAALGNTSIGAAIMSDAGVTTAAINVSGSPVVQGNTGTSGEANIWIGANTIIKVPTATGLGSGAKVGVYGSTDALNTAGNQFATADGGDASTIANLAGAFVNDKDKTLLSAPGTGTAINWGAGIVKETVGSDGTGAFVAYYDSLNEAAAHVTAGNSLEIMKTHALKATLTDGSSGNVSFAASCTVRNILNPGDTSENPFVDADGNPAYTDAAEPVVYFGNANTAAGSMQLIVPAGVTVDLKGVKFSGYYYDGTNAAAASTTRAQAGISVAATGTLTIDDGTAGTLPGGAERGACATVIENFYNTSTAAATCGGALYIKGEATMTSGTLSGNRANGNGWLTGGAAVCVYGADAKFTMDGGTIEKQTTANGAVADNPISVFNGTFIMNKGTIQNNTGRCAGAIWVSSGTGTSAAPGGTVTINGGQILNNTGTNDCGAIWSNGTTTIKDCLIKGNTGNIGAVCSRADSGTVTISGHTQIVGNKSKATGRGAVSWFGNNTNLGSITLEGSPVITGNTNTVDNKEINLEDTPGNPSGTPILKVGKLNNDAYIGMTPIAARNGSTDDTTLFAYSVDADADNAGYLKAFYNQSVNDADGYPLRGMAGDDNKVVWGTVTPTVKVTETVTASDGTQTDVVHTFGGTTAIADAFACVKELPAANMVAGKKADNVTDKDYVGYFPVELLVDTYEQTNYVPVWSAAGAKIMLTTAKTDAEDGYPYRGDTTKESGRALVKRAFTGAAIFSLRDTGADLTTKNVVIDGVKETYSASVSSTIGCLRAFYLYSNCSLTLDDGTLVRNSDAGAGTDGKIVYYGGAVCLGASDSAESAPSLCMKEGATIDSCTAINCGGAISTDKNALVTMEGGTISNCTGGGWGGAAYIYNTGSTFTMSGGTIDGCSAQYGGAIYNRSGSTFTMTGGTISGCTASQASDKTRGAGGAIFNNGSSTAKATVALSGNAKIENCMAGSGSAIYNRSGGEVLTIVDNVQITGCSLLASDGIQPCAVANHSDALGKSAVVVAGSPTIYGNLDYTKTEQRNVLDSSGLNVGSVIVVGIQDDDGNVTGLNDDAKIGVYATTNYNAGNTFARTATTKSTDYANLSVFKNDKNSRLTGLASAADPYNRVIWSSAEKLVLKKTLPAAAAHDTWFTVQLTDTDSGEVYRQAIKVPAGSTSGSATVLVQSGIKYEVADVGEQSSWRYVCSGSSYAGATTTTPADTWDATNSALTLACPDTSAYDPETTTTPRTLTMQMAASDEDGSQSWMADSASVVNTITMS